MTKPLIDFRPLHNWMVVRKEYHDKTKSGIFIARKHEERPSVGMILAIGNGVLEPLLQPGTRIYFPWAAGTTFEFEGETLALIKEPDVGGIVGKDTQIEVKITSTDRYI